MPKFRRRDLGWIHFRQRVYVHIHYERIWHKKGSHLNLGLNVWTRSTFQPFVPCGRENDFPGRSLWSDCQSNDTDTSHRKRCDWTFPSTNKLLEALVEMRFAPRGYSFRQSDLCRWSIRELEHDEEELQRHWALGITHHSKRWTRRRRDNRAVLKPDLARCRWKSLVATKSPLTRH